jgi:hypothetical protein
MNPAIQPLNSGRQTLNRAMDALNAPFHSPLPATHPLNPANQPIIHTDYSATSGDQAPRCGMLDSRQFLAPVPRPAHPAGRLLVFVFSS